MSCLTKTALSCSVRQCEDYSKR